MLTKTFSYAADHGIIRSLSREQRSLIPSSIPFPSFSSLLMRLKHYTYPMYLNCCKADKQP
jgi:hypothetical protein